MSVSGTQPDSPVGGDGVETVADSAADGRTPLSAGVESFNGREALRGDREALIGIAREALLPEDVTDPYRGVSPERQMEAVIDAFLAAGFRLVSVDDDTVERVAEALWRQFWREVPGYGITKEFWRGPARAAVQALRDGRQS